MNSIQDKDTETLLPKNSVEVKRVYQYPAAMLEKVAQVLGIDQDFADLLLLRLELESREGASPMLIIQAGGLTLAEARERQINYLKEVSDAMAKVNGGQ